MLDGLRAVLPPGGAIVPGHPVAGTENSGPDAGFAQLFHNRWCILTPDERTEAFAVERLSDFWSRLGATVEVMEPKHHDLVLDGNSQQTNLTAYTMVGTASDQAREVGGATGRARGGM